MEGQPGGGSGHLGFSGTGLGQSRQDLGAVVPRLRVPVTVHGPALAHRQR